MTWSRRLPIISMARPTRICAATRWFEYFKTSARWWSVTRGRWGTSTRSRRIRREGVALLRAAGLQALFEPTDPLRRAAMSKGVRHHYAARLPLQPVVPDRGGGVHRRLDIALFDNVLHAIGVVGPNAREAIGLQLQAHRNLIRAPLIAAPALVGRFLKNSERVLYVVADFMRDHIGFGEFARRMEAVLHLLEEGQVEIHLLVIRAIEGP